MKFKKGQSALEYLVTYGWAILAIVVVAAILWYFGVFNPGQYATTSARSTGFGAVNIVDQKYSGTNILLRVGNGVGQQINVTGITLEGAAGTLTSTLLLNGGDEGTLNATVANCGNTGASYDVDVVITYNNIKSGLSGLTSVGTLKGACS